MQIKPPPKAQSRITDIAFCMDSWLHGGGWNAMEMIEPEITREQLA